MYVEENPTKEMIKIEMKYIEINFILCSNEKHKHTHKHKDLVCSLLHDIPWCLLVSYHSLTRLGLFYLNRLYMI